VVSAATAAAIRQKDKSRLFMPSLSRQCLRLGDRGCPQTREARPVGPSVHRRFRQKCELEVELALAELETAFSSAISEIRSGKTWAHIEGE
jgi:hypothetical protein